MESFFNLERFVQFILSMKELGINYIGYEINNREDGLGLLKLYPKYKV